MPTTETAETAPVTDKFQARPGQGQPTAEEQQNTQNRGTGETASVDEFLAENGMSKEDLDRLIEAGLVIPKPQKIEELPGDLRKQLDELVQNRTREAESIVRSQLNDSLNKVKQDNSEIRALLEEQQRKVREQEEARRREEEEERLGSASVDEKLAHIRNESKSAIEEFSREAEQKITQLEQQLRAERLASFRKDLMHQAGGEIIPELVPDPTRNPNITEEELAASVEQAKAKYAELRERIAADFQAQQPPQQPAPDMDLGQRIPHNRGVDMPPRNAHISQPPDSFQDELKNVKNASKEELDKLKAKAWQRLGLAM